MVDLGEPVLPVTADAVQEKHERPLAGDREREARGGTDKDRFQRYSALAPEILTASPRLSRSVFMKFLKSSGELPMGS